MDIFNRIVPPIEALTNFQTWTNIRIATDGSILSILELLLCSTLFKTLQGTYIYSALFKHCRYVMSKYRSAVESAQLTRLGFKGLTICEIFFRYSTSFKEVLLGIKVTTVMERRP